MPQQQAIETQSKPASAAGNLRFPLTDRSIAHLPFAERGQYFAFDEKLGGFQVVVGRKRKTFMVRSEIRIAGKRIASARVTIGDCSKITVAKARTIAEGYLSEMRQGRHPRPDAVKRPCAVSDRVEQQQSSDKTAREDAEGPSLREAWERYKAALIKKGRSAGTIAGYEDHVTRVLKIWIDRPLKDLAEDPDLVARKHDAITLASGPYAANGAMRTLRAIYNHAWLKNKKVLSRDNPVDAVDWNKERRRNSGMGVSDLPGWFNELARLENPIRREFHLMEVLSGSRPAALKRARLNHLDLRRRILHIPAPKGGEDRAFDIPLSREMIRSLMRVIRFGRAQHPVEARIWLFPAESKAGHIYTTQEDRADLSKWGNDLRQTYRTIATIAKVNGVDAKLLMNHAIPGVNEGYITREKILEDHLRQQQQAITDVIFAPIRDLREKDGPVATWLRPRSARAQIALAQETRTAHAHLHEVRRRKALQARENNADGQY
ncbi:integrase arm-type DNA-binding domain-containing protein [Sphingomonas sp. CL5.1]|uniref:integrase family protein n=1 Tax=Sphingomonas sp. CL5.1 TaxID=2653203 RepID=UPI001583EB04|nr:integrase family protein [Sphingomonas sp. CL5.1]QKS00432.1 integrase arm-type DNA-binding domain-containing protein [Sphingomonas sp. CL5.1]